MYRTGNSQFLFRISLFCLLVFAFQSAWASQPNIVLSRALHFSDPNGHPITLEPGKYFVEPAGDSELRLTREGQQMDIVLHAEALTHEQYELFSPMAMTRPSKQGKFFITLLLPGGQKLEAVGSTKAPPPPTMPHIALAPTTTPPASKPGTAAEIALPSVEKPMIRKTPSPALEKPALAYQAPSTTDLQEQTDSLFIPQDDFSLLSVYAPNHLGQTIHEQPRLF